MKKRKGLFDGYDHGRRVAFHSFNLCVGAVDTPAELFDSLSEMLVPNLEQYAGYRDRDILPGFDYWQGAYDGVKSILDDVWNDVVDGVTF